MDLNKFLDLLNQELGKRPILFEDKSPHDRCPLHMFYRFKKNGDIMPKEDDAVCFHAALMDSDDGTYFTEYTSPTIFSGATPAFYHVEDPKIRNLKIPDIPILPGILFFGDLNDPSNLDPRKMIDRRGKPLLLDLQAKGTVWFVDKVDFYVEKNYSCQGRLCTGKGQGYSVLEDNLQFSFEPKVDTHR